MKSALFQGRVRHRRFGERRHRFLHSLFMVYVDLDELDDAFAGSRLWSSQRPAVAWLRRNDYFGGRQGARWSAAVRDLVADRSGRRPQGSVRLLTNPRTLGLRMNPVSFYYCFDADDELEAVVAEVTNTPWDERHLYVVHREALEASSGNGRASSKVWSASFDKSFHVSPFLPMDLRYRWVFSAPSEKLLFHMENYRKRKKVFDATLSLRRQEIDPQALRRVLFRQPLMTAKIAFWIYFHAGVLMLKGIRFHPHPKHVKGKAA